MKKIQKLNCMLLLSCILLGCFGKSFTAYAASYTLGSFPAIKEEMITNKNFMVIEQTYTGEIILITSDCDFFAITNSQNEVVAGRNTSVRSIQKYTIPWNNTSVWQDNGTEGALYIDSPYEVKIHYSSAPVKKVNYINWEYKFTDEVLYESDAHPLAIPTPTPEPTPIPPPPEGTYVIGSLPPIQKELIDNKEFVIINDGLGILLLIADCDYFGILHNATAMSAGIGESVQTTITKYQLSGSTWQYNSQDTTIWFCSELNPTYTILHSSVPVRRFSDDIFFGLIHAADGHPLPTSAPSPKPTEIPEETPEPTPELTPGPTLIPTGIPNDTDYAALEQVYSIDARDNIKNLMQGFILYVLPIALSIKGVQIAIQLAIQFFSAIAKK